MNSLTVVRTRARRFWATAACGGIILGFVACSGSSDHGSSPGDCAAAGNGNAAGDAAAGQNSGGSHAQGGKGGSDPVGSAGDGSTAGTAGNGGTSPVETGSGGDSGLPAGGAETASGGQAAGGETSSNAGGQAAGGESSGGAGGEGGGVVIPVDPICGANMAQVGAYSLWCGKVNMHKTAEGDWVHDADCSSGCNIYGVNYCKKFYPNATKVVAVDQTASVVKDWKNAGCADSTPDGKGISGEAVCCAPLL